jgi:acetyl-CoA carboxylase biotin carboxyl carrier protein
MILFWMAGAQNPRIGEKQFSQVAVSALPALQAASSAASDGPKKIVIFRWDALMNIDEVKDLIRVVLQSDISEFELEHSGTKIKLRRGRKSTAILVPPAAASNAASPQSLTPPGEVPEDPEEAGLHIITSPIVGTFYRAPSPDANPYVKMGDNVKEGSTLCLVEAMKLMNEIPTDVEGEVARIYVENGNSVEFGQRLFGIRLGKQG